MHITYNTYMYLDSNCGANAHSVYFCSEFIPAQTHIVLQVHDVHVLCVFLDTCICIIEPFFSLFSMEFWSGVMGNILLWTHTLQGMLNH